MVQLSKSHNVGHKPMAQMFVHHCQHWLPHYSHCLRSFLTRKKMKKAFLNKILKWIQGKPWVEAFPNLFDQCVLFSQYKVALRGRKNALGAFWKGQKGHNNIFLKKVTFQIEGKVLNFYDIFQFFEIIWLRRRLRCLSRGAGTGTLQSDLTSNHSINSLIMDKSVRISLINGIRWSTTSVDLDEILARASARGRQPALTVDQQDAAVCKSRMLSLIGRPKVVVLSGVVPERLLRWWLPYWRRATPGDAEWPIVVRHVLQLRSTCKITQINSEFSSSQ